MNMNNFKFVGDGVDQVCQDLVGHTNWSWGLQRTIDLIQNDPIDYDKNIRHREIDSVIIIYKNPIEGDDDE
jgi:hypothetical protein